MGGGCVESMVRGRELERGEEQRGRVIESVAADGLTVEDARKTDRECNKKTCRRAGVRRRWPLLCYLSMPACHSGCDQTCDRPRRSALAAAPSEIGAARSELTAACAGGCPIEVAGRPMGGRAEGSCCECVVTGAM